MTRSEFENQINILEESYDKKLSGKVKDSYFEELKLYPSDQVKRAVQKIYMTDQRLEYGTNLLVLIKNMLGELGYPNPDSQIKDWLSVIKHQELYFKKNWEKKPPKPEKIRCLPKLPDPLYWDKAVEIYKEK